MNAPLALNRRGRLFLLFGTSHASSSAALANATLAFYPTDEEIPMSPTGKSMSPEQERSHGKLSKLSKTSLGGHHAYDPARNRRRLDKRCRLHGIWLAAAGAKASQAYCRLRWHRCPSSSNAGGARSMLAETLSGERVCGFAMVVLRICKPFLGHFIPCSLLSKIARRVGHSLALRRVD
jgi:hypothetical protein